MIYLFIGWSKVAFRVTSTLVDSHVQFCEKIVKSDVSVYQIFQRFRFGKNFPSRWTAKPYSHLPIPLPFLLNSLFFFLRFPLLPRFFSFLIRLTFARACFFFPSPLLRKLDSCFQFCAQNRGKEATFLCFFYFVFGPVETFVSGVASTFSPMPRRFFSSPRIVAKLVRLASLSRLIVNAMVE